MVLLCWLFHLFVYMILISFQLKNYKRLMRRNMGILLAPLYARGNAYVFKNLRTHIEKNKKRLTAVGIEPTRLIARDDYH